METQPQHDREDTEDRTIKAQRLRRGLLEHAQSGPDVPMGTRGAALSRPPGCSHNFEFKGVSGPPRAQWCGLFLGSAHGVRDLEDSEGAE